MSLSENIDTIMTQLVERIHGLDTFTETDLNEMINQTKRDVLNAISNHDTHRMHMFVESLTSLTTPNGDLCILPDKKIRAAM